MAVPKKKTSHRRTAQRRSAYGRRISFFPVTKCETCERFKPNNQICPYCGSYKKRIILHVKT